MRIAKKTAAAAAAKESDSDETTKGPNKDDTDSTKVSLASLILVGIKNWWKAFEERMKIGKTLCKLANKIG